MSERRLIVVVPELPPVTKNQYAHHVSLLSELAKIATVTAVVERGPAVSVPGVTVICQRRRNPVARAAEIVAILVRLRRDGYRHAYGYYSPYYGVAGGMAARLTGLRLAYWHCRGDFFNRTVDKRWRLRDTLVHTLPLVLSLRLCDRVVTGTARLADLYASTFRIRRSKIAVVPNDIDLSRWPKPGTRSGATVLFVGRLTEHKGAHLLPEYWRALSALAPGAKLVIAGGGQLEGPLREEMSDEIAGGSVRLEGTVSNAEASVLMGEASVLVVPSLSEGFPRVLLESMAAGLPFVATDVGGIAEIVPPEIRNTLVSPGSATHLAEASARLLNDPDALAVIAEQGLQHVRRFDVQRVAPQLLAAVTEAAA